MTSQRLKEPMAGENQRSVVTARAAVAASLCRKRRSNCGLNYGKEVRGENGQEDCFLSCAVSRQSQMEIKSLLSRVHLLHLVCPTLLSLTFPIWGTSSLGSSPLVSSNQNRFPLWNQKDLVWSFKADKRVGDGDNVKKNVTRLLVNESEKKNSHLLAIQWGKEKVI